MNPEELRDAADCGGCEHCTCASALEEAARRLADVIAYLEEGRGCWAEELLEVARGES